MKNITVVTFGEYDELAGVWESSVRATHSFLEEEDIASIRERLPEYFAAVDLRVWRGVNGAIVGFAGVAAAKLEMLFVDASARGRGVGKGLLRYAVDEMGVRVLDVNEQNPSAVGFYEHMGFHVTGRSGFDGEGRPFPLLHMELV